MHKIICRQVSLSLTDPTSRGCLLVKPEWSVIIGKNCKPGHGAFKFGVCDTHLAIRQIKYETTIEVTNKDIWKWKKLPGNILENTHPCVQKWGMDVMIWIYPRKPGQIKGRQSKKWIIQRILKHQKDWLNIEPKSRVWRIYE